MNKLIFVLFCSFLTALLFSGTVTIIGLVCNAESFIDLAKYLFFIGLFTGAYNGFTMDTDE